MTVEGILPGIPLKNPQTLPNERGVCSISHGENTFYFRTNPNKVRFTYVPITHVDPTYGGRVIQLLSARIDDLIVTVECGNGRWDYYREMVYYFRDLFVNQKDMVPATFEYTTRGWKFNVFAVSIPFADDIQQVAREVELIFKVQEDVSGIATQSSLSAELARLQEGIGWKKSKYNQPDPNDGQDGEAGWLGLGQAAGNAVDALRQGISGDPIGAVAGLTGIPGLGG